jgi:hypothetical protein
MIGWHRTLLRCRNAGKPASPFFFVQLPFLMYRTPPSQAQGKAVSAIAIGYQAGPRFIGIVAIAPARAQRKPDNSVHPDVTHRRVGRGLLTRLPLQRFQERDQGHLVRRREP